MKQLFKEIKSVWELKQSLTVFVIQTEVKKTNQVIKDHFNDKDLDSIPLNKVTYIKIDELFYYIFISTIQIIHHSSEINEITKIAIG